MVKKLFFGCKCLSTVGHLSFQRFIYFVNSEALTNAIRRVKHAECKDKILTEQSTKK